MTHLEKIWTTNNRLTLITNENKIEKLKRTDRLTETVLNFFKSNKLVNEADPDGSDSKEDDSDTNDLIKPRNRRKSLIPQRAIQLDDSSQIGSLENSLESAHGLDYHLNNSNMNDNILLSHNENVLDLRNEYLLENINDFDIFKDLQEEADCEKLNNERLDNVKDEWRADWGVKCNRCEQVFLSKTDFDKHYTETYNLLPVYTCSFCNKTAEKYTTFRSHCYRHITEGRYKCQKCSKGFSLQSMLNIHVLAKHTKTKPFICDECGRTFATKPGLRIHLNKHNSETKEDFLCLECGKVLHTKGGLTSHMKVHQLGRRFMCEVCGKTFTQKVNMQQHVKQHTGEKPYGCDKCDKRFTEKSHLTRHSSFHSDLRPFKCDICQKMYKTERCLKVHAKVHAPNRRYACQSCPKRFLSSTKLKQHCNTHTGDRPFKCSYCERTFTNYPNKLKHTRRKHNVHPKTSKNVETQKPKEEIQNNFGQLNSIPTIITPTNSNNTIESLSTDQLLGDISLSRTEEFLIPQNLFNFTLSDIPLPQIDIPNNNNSVGLLVPYFQSPLQNPQQFIPQTSSNNTTPLQFNEFLYSQYFNQPLMCD